MGSNESHFNVSLIVRDKVTRQCPQPTTFEGKGEVYSNRGSSAYQPHALPLGQTGSQSLLFLAYQRLSVTYCVSVIYSVVLQTRILMDNSCWPRLLDENTGRILPLAVQIFDESPITTHFTQHANVCIDPQVDQTHISSPPHFVQVLATQHKIVVQIVPNTLFSILRTLSKMYGMRADAAPTALIRVRSNRAASPSVTLQ